MAEYRDSGGLAHHEGSPDPDAAARNAVLKVVGEYFYYEHEDAFADGASVDEMRSLFQNQAPRYLDALQRGEAVVKDQLEKEGVSFDVLPEESGRGRDVSYQGKQVFELILEEIPIVVNPGEEDEYPASAYSETINWKIKPRVNDPFQRMNFRRQAERAGVKSFEGTVSFWEEPALVALALRTGLAEQSKLYSKFSSACRRVDEMRRSYKRMMNQLHSYRDSFAVIDAVRNQLDEIDEGDEMAKKVEFVSALGESDGRLERAMEEVLWYESEMKALRGLFLRHVKGHQRPTDAPANSHRTREVNDQELVEFERGLAVSIMGHFLKSDPAEAGKPSEIFELEKRSLRDPRSAEDSLVLIHDFVAELLYGDSQETQALRDQYGDARSAIGYYVQFAVAKVEANIRDLLPQMNIDPDLGMEYVEGVVRQVLHRDFPLALLQEVEYKSDEWYERVGELNAFHPTVPYRRDFQERDSVKARLYKHAEAELKLALRSGSRIEQIIPEEGYSKEETERLIGSVISALEAGQKGSERVVFRLMNLLGIEWDHELMAFKVNTGRTPLGNKVDFASPKWMWLADTADLFMRRANEHFVAEESRNIDIESGDIRGALGRNRLRAVFERVVLQEEYRKYLEDREIHRLTRGDYMGNLQRALKGFAEASDPRTKAEISGQIDDIVDLHVLRTLLGITKTGSYPEHTFQEQAENERTVVNIVRGAMIEVVQSIPASFLVLRPDASVERMKQIAQEKIAEIAEEYSTFEGIEGRLRAIQDEILDDIYENFEGEPVTAAVAEFVAMRDGLTQAQEDELSSAVRRPKETLFIPEYEYEDRRLGFPKRSKLSKKIEKKSTPSIELAIPLTREDLDIIRYIKRERSLSRQEIFTRGLRLKHDYHFLEDPDDLDEESEIVKDLDGAILPERSKDEDLRDTFTVKLSPTDQRKLKELQENLREVGEDVDEVTILREALRSIEFAAMHAQFDGTLVVPRHSGKHLRYHLFF